MPQLARSRLVDRYDGGVSVVTLWSRRWLGAVLLARAAPALRDAAQGPPGHGGGASAAPPGGGASAAPPSGGASAA
jgi:hypothetical protein